MGIEHAGYVHTVAEDKDEARVARPSRGTLEAGSGANALWNALLLNTRQFLSVIQTLRAFRRTQLSCLDVRAKAAHSEDKRDIRYVQCRREGGVLGTMMMMMMMMRAYASWRPLEGHLGAPLGGLLEASREPLGGVLGGWPEPEPHQSRRRAKLGPWSPSRDP